MKLKSLVAVVLIFFSIMAAAEGDTNAAVNISIGDGNEFLAGINILAGENPIIDVNQISDVNISKTPADKNAGININASEINSNNSGFNDLENNLDLNMSVTDNNSQNTDENGFNDSNSFLNDANAFDPKIFDINRVIEDINNAIDDIVEVVENIVGDIVVGVTGGNGEEIVIVESTVNVDGIIAKCFGVMCKTLDPIEEKLVIIDSNGINDLQAKIDTTAADVNADDENAQISITPPSGG